MILLTERRVGNCPLAGKGRCGTGQGVASTSDGIAHGIFGLLRRLSIMRSEDRLRLTLSRGSVDLLVLKILSRPGLHGYAMMSAFQVIPAEVLRA
jgi:hypothetical protein